MRGQLELPQTGADVPYGSPAMAAAVSAIIDGAESEPQIFATAGHEDGVFACGADPHATGAALVALLGRAQAQSLQAQSPQAAEHDTEHCKESDCGR